MTTMTASQFDFLCKIVRTDSAIVLESGKEYLVESRLAPIARVQGLGSVGDLVQRLVSSPSAQLRAQVVDAMTTNETSFFRDVHPWQTLREHILPDLFAARAVTRRLNIWCAACSSGQEPFSLAMTLLEHFPEQARTWNIKIMATDLSPSMVERCKSGRFTQLEVNRGLPAALLMRYFVKDGAEWRLTDDVRRMVETRAANLVVPSSLPQMGGIDLVMIRNVLIYFDDATKAGILSSIHRLLKPESYLMLGSSEVSTGLSSNFTRCQTGKTIYFRPTA
ncbi:MAG: protein-glutamate O-methyltransferase CheR [Acidimicrobiales bacterium]|nr:protein-glutamate O-methyltransferase CheR [Acidimicrobiales bacterium]